MELADGFDRSRVKTLLESASADLRAANAEGEKVVDSVESIKDDLSDLAEGDVELIRLLDVVLKRAKRTKESLGHLERALIAFDQRVRISFGAAL